MDYYLCIHIWMLLYHTKRKSMTKIDFHRFRQKRVLPFRSTQYNTKIKHFFFFHTFVRWIFFFACQCVCVWRDTLYARMLFGSTLKALPVWLLFIFGDGYGFFYVPSMRFLSHSFSKKKNKYSGCMTPLGLIELGHDHFFYNSIIW